MFLLLTKMLKIGKEGRMVQLIGDHCATMGDSSLNGARMEIIGLIQFHSKGSEET